MIIKDQIGSNFKFTKFKRYKFIYILLALNFFFFILGAYLQRAGELKKIYYSVLEIPEVIKINSYEIFGLNKFKTLQIDIDFKNKKKLDGIITDLGEYAIYTEDDWVDASLIYNDKQHFIKLRPAGTHSDHRLAFNKQSFRIEIKKDNYVEGLRKFSLTEFERRSFYSEWIFQKMLEDEGLVSHKMRVVNLKLNGKVHGIMLLQEQYDKLLLERNNLTESVIIGIEKDNYFSEINDNKINSYFPYSIKKDYFKNSDLKITSNKTVSKNDRLSSLKKIALKKLESFRQNKIDASEVFDVEKIAKIFALRSLLASAEFDWRDLKFYLNPYTNKLEPIGKEISSLLGTKQFMKNYFVWERIIDKEFGENSFLKNLFSDRKIYEAYLNELNRVSKKNYIDNFIEKHGGELNELISKINKFKKYDFSYDHLKKSSSLISNKLNSKNNINAYMDIDDLKNINNIKVINLIVKAYKHNLISPECISYKNIDYFCTTNHENKKKTFLDNNKLFLKLEFEKTNKQLVDILDKNKLKLNYYNFIKNSTSKKNIQLYDKPFFNKPLNQVDLQNNLKRYSWLDLNTQKKTVNIKKGEWTLDEDLNIPDEYKLIINEGTSIDLNGHNIIVNAPIFFMGNPKERITIYQKNNLEVETGGLFINSRNQKSEISYVNFYNLRKVIDYLPGSITFYNSNIEINNTNFTSNFVADDYINLVNSNFIIRNSNFISTNQDAIDSDFSNGSIKKTDFYTIGNDAIDFSGSTATIDEVKISNTVDKGVSVGEKSKVHINHISLEDLKFGIISKDLSELKIDNLNFENVKYLFAAYIKKKNYGPATIKFFDKNNYINKDNIIVDAKSKILIDSNGKTKKYSNLNSNQIELLIN